MYVSASIYFKFTVLTYPVCYSAQARLREAASEKADAEKILLVKAAEADAESKYLSGLGVAKQRKAIVDGLRDTISGFSEQVCMYVCSMYVYVLYVCINLKKVAIIVIKSVCGPSTRHVLCVQNYSVYVCIYCMYV